ncbi:MAG: hypothetical protein ACXW2E_01610 [Nitrososphaeraceae archaeon]
MSEINGITLNQIDLVCKSFNTLDTNIQYIDGVRITTGDTVLFPSMTNPILNGVYTATVTGDTVDWARTVGFSITNDFINGVYVTPRNGNTYSDTIWFKEPNLAFVLGTDPVFFSLQKATAIDVFTSGASSVSIGTGSNIIGKVGIDQTTPGTTNAISQTTASINTTTMQNAVSATGNGTLLDVSGKSVAILQITGTFSAIVDFEASVDDTNWFSINATKLDNDSLMTSTSSTGLYRIACGGIKSLRARVTWSSGTSVTVIGRSTLANNNTNVVKLNNSSHTSVVSLVRPGNTNQYAINDAIGDVGGSAVLSFLVVGTAGQCIMITGVEVRIDSATLPTANGPFVLRLYNTSPTAIADNAAWDLVSGDRSKWLGDIPISAPGDRGSTCYIRIDQLAMQVLLVSSTIYGVLTTDNAITFAENSTPITVTLHTTEL